jgi:aminoglycoside phosphotransferase (APT) family kinase protein
MPAAEQVRQEDQDGATPAWVDWEPSEPIDSPPPSETLDWVEAELDSIVLGALPLPGGLSSAVHRLELLDGRMVVLRRYVLDDWIEREPEIPTDEARILGLLPDLDLPFEIPTLAAADPTGERADVPAIVMSEVPGRPDLAPPDPGPWVDALAECLAAIHAIDPDLVDDEVGPWRRWDEPDRPIPSWTSDRQLWQAARERVPDELPVDRARFLHRDFHPCNVHWADDELVGVVDWLGACLGEPAADLAHCRWNLAVVADIEAAERFTDHYRAITGYGTDTLPYDLSTGLSAPVGPFPVFAWHSLGRCDLTHDVVADRIDGWLAHLLAA